MANIERRDFLKLVGAGGIGAGAGFMLSESTRHPLEYLVPYAVPPEEFSPGIATWYNSVCSMCSAGCGITVRTREGRAKKIEGNPAHPVSQGTVCALGQAGLQALYNPDRLTGPLVQNAERGSAGFVKTTWDEALGRVGETLSALKAAGQGDRICLLTEGVGGHLAELFERFMAELGADRLLHYEFAHPQTLYAANQRLFGETRLPYYDLQNADYVISFGADYLSNWISPVHHSLGFGRSRHARPDARGYFVQVEPRMSVSGAAADEWLAAAPGTEGLFALAIARHLVEQSYRGTDRDAWAAALDRYTPAFVAEAVDLPAARIERVARKFAGSKASLAIGGGTACSHTNAVATLVAVNALNYLVGNLGKPGGVVFNPEPAVGRDTQARHATYRAMRELADAARAGKIDVLIVNNTNPLFTLPDAAEFAAALQEIPLIVSLSSFPDETTAMADVILPSHTYLESWGDHSPEPGVGFPVGSVSQPVVSPLYNTRATGDIVLALARQVGLDEALPWPSMEDYLRDSWRTIHAQVSGGAEGFDTFWRDILRAGVWGEDTGRDHASVSVSRNVIASIDVGEPEFAGAEETYPFVLYPYESNALRDGRGANLPWLQELPDAMTSIVYGSWIELNPQTAAQLGVKEGDVLDVESAYGKIAAPVYVYPAIRPDVIAIPIGQGHTEYGRYARNRGVNPIRILAPQTEPETGALAWSATRVKLTRTGRHVELVKTGGESRELGRDIVQIASATPVPGEAHSAAVHSTRLRSIPITVEPT